MGHEQSPTEYEEATVNLSATEERKVIKGNNGKKDSPKDKEVHKDELIKINEIIEERDNGENNYSGRNVRNLKSKNICSPLKKQILARLGFGMENKLMTQTATLVESEENMVWRHDLEGLEVNESAPSSQDRYCPEYEFVQVKHERENLEVYVNDNKTYIKDNVEKDYSPETREVNRNPALDKANTSLGHTRTNIDWKKTEETQVEKHQKEEIC